MDLGLAADGASYCPSFTLLDDAGDAQLAAALAREVTDGCPEPRPGETGARWWVVTVMAGVATDDGGRPAHGPESDVVRLGRGQGVLLVTDQAATGALTVGEWLGGAAALAISFDLDEVAAVDTDPSLVRRRVRSMTLELTGASWGAIGLSVHGELVRHSGQREAPLRKADGTELAARLADAARH
jgi:hypothetical protein